MIEEWRAVDGWPYEVSSLGRVRRNSHAAGATVGLILQPVRKDNGYVSVTLSYKNRQRQVAVHILVCTAFHGPKPPGMEVRHIDGTRNNNVEANVRWGTPTENAEDRTAHGTAAFGDRHHMVSVSDAAFRAILAAWDLHPRGYGQTARFIENVTAQFEVSKGFVEDAIYGRRRAVRLRQETRL